MNFVYRKIRLRLGDIKTEIVCKSSSILNKKFPIELTMEEILQKGLFRCPWFKREENFEYDGTTMVRHY